MGAVNTFRALVVHRDREFRYSFFLPEGWRSEPIASDAGRGTAFVPDADDPLTSFSAEARDLGVAVRPSDLKTLRGGFLDGLRGMPGSRIEHQESEAIGDLISMEARHTYLDGEATRLRWVRLLYRGTTQVRLVAQGSSCAAFERWEPSYFQAMRTFRFGDWWADVTGQEWLETPFAEGEDPPPRAE